MQYYCVQDRFAWLCMSPCCSRVSQGREMHLLTAGYLVWLKTWLSSWSLSESEKKQQLVVLCLNGFCLDGYSQMIGLAKPKYLLDNKFNQHKNKKNQRKIKFNVNVFYFFNLIYYFVRSVVAPCHCVNKSANTYKMR